MIVFNKYPHLDGSCLVEVRCANLFATARVEADAKYSDIARWENWATRQVFYAANHIQGAIGAYASPAIFDSLARLLEIVTTEERHARFLGHCLIEVEGCYALGIRIVNLPGNRQIVAADWQGQVIATVYPYSNDLDVCW